MLMFVGDDHFETANRLAALEDPTAHELYWVRWYGGDEASDVPEDLVKKTLRIWLWNPTVVHSTEEA
jgi:hypothetical protein